MAKCANCVSDALYAYKINPALTINYCANHLPKFLNDQKAAGLLKPEVEAPKPSKKKAEVVEEAPVTEEASTEDAIS
jgi:hypothetical protein